jgi:hypothetical protein
MRNTCLALLLLPLTLAANPALNTVVGRTVYHADNSRTESVRDPNTRELTEVTYDANGVMTVKKVSLLNERGEPIQGNIYDGRGNLVARSVSIYDEFGRRTEDRSMNLNGEVFQRVIYEYDASGKAKKPKVVNVGSATAPTLKPAVIDFTQETPGAPGAPSTNRFAPTPAPAGQGPIYAPGAEPPGTAPAEAPKPGFFKRLFKGKEKK